MNSLLFLAINTSVTFYKPSEPKPKLQFEAPRVICSSCWRRKFVKKSSLSSSFLVAFSFLFNSFHLIFTCWNYLGCYLALILAYLWVWVLIKFSFLVRFWSYSSYFEKLITYLRSLWKNEQNHIRFVHFWVDLVTPVPETAPATARMERRRWSVVSLRPRQV
jgi:hypothetical protein